MDHCSIENSTPLHSLSQWSSFSMYGHCRLNMDKTGFQSFCDVTNPVLKSDFQRAPRRFYTLSNKSQTAFKQIRSNIQSKEYQDHILFRRNAFKVTLKLIGFRRKFKCMRHKHDSHKPRPCPSCPPYQPLPLHSFNPSPCPTKAISAHAGTRTLRLRMATWRQR